MSVILPPMDRKCTEMDSETGLVIPTFGRAIRLFGRALLLRCPNCGKGPVLEHWMKLCVKCGTCGLRLQRGEHDAVMGFALILYTLIGMVSYALLFVTLLVTRATPWDLLQFGLPVLVVVGLFALFPFAKLLWLAFDLMLRPVTPSELEWHRTSTREFESEREVMTLASPRVLARVETGHPTPSPSASDLSLNPSHDLSVVTASFPSGPVLTPHATRCDPAITASS